jgi:hypothetical protein
MINKYAEILVHQHTIEPTGAQYRTYEWIGRKYWPIFIGDDVRNRLPWSFLEIEKSLDGRVTLCVRKDALLPIGWLIIAKVNTVNVLQWVYYRIIATLMIWGLAYIPNGTIPSWRHIGKKKDE